MINKAILMGRLTRDPELRHTNSNIPVTSFTLAVDRRYKNNDSDQPTADFIDVVAWNQTADFVSKYFRKGQLVAVVGRIQTRKWTDNEGKTRVAFEVVADEVHFAEPKRDSSAASYTPAPASSHASSSAPQAAARDVPDPSTGFDEVVGDDELPF